VQVSEEADTVRADFQNLPYGRDVDFNKLKGVNQMRIWILVATIFIVIGVMFHIWIDNNYAVLGSIVALEWFCFILGIMSANTIRSHIA
jgi:hypothetical protein